MSTRDVRISPDSAKMLWEGFSALYMDTSSGSGWGQPLSSSGSCLKKFEIQPVVECSTNPGCEVSNNYFSRSFKMFMNESRTATLLTL